ncbi:MAG: ABC transporter ATP-binding protein [Chloroflexi bacterium]|nr:ABC transporter ATP-binding protein [Chloroflexota bacterium]
MIEVKNLTKYYGARRAIEDISFQLAKGEILGLLGPNGAGKTTTMRILTGFMPPTSGTATLAGFDVTTDSIEVRKRLGYLPETVPLYPELTVRQYLNFHGKIKGLDAKRRRTRIEYVATACHVDNVIDTIISKLSRGYRQRVGLAQALIHDPPVLILDEPTVGLDPRQIIETRSLIKGLGGNHSIILSTHILPEVAMTCSRVVIINDGRVVAEDTPDGLTRRLQGAEMVELDVRGPAEQIVAAFRKLDSVANVAVTSVDGRSRYTVQSAEGRDVRERLAQTVVQNGWGLLEMRPVGMSLEEIFLKLTTREDEV